MKNVLASLKKHCFKFLDYLFFKSSTIPLYLFFGGLLVIYFAISTYTMFFSSWRIGTEKRFIINIITGIILMLIGIINFLNKIHKRYSKRKKDNRGDK